jgi:hypothetical protein
MINVIQDTKPVTDRWTVLERGLNMMIASNFKDYKDWRVLSNIKKYKPSMDKFIFAQKTGKIPEICEIYWKGEFVCEVNILETPAQALTKINDGLIDLIKKKG